MTQSLSVYWQRLTQRPSDDERTEAPVLDLAGCFGTPVMVTIRPEALTVRPADAAPARLAPR